MLTALGLAMIATFTLLVMTNRMSTVTALTIVPVLFALLGGFGTEIPAMMIDGMRKVAIAAAFLLFALLFFGVMIDAGLFEPIVTRVLRWVKNDPVKVAVGTSVMTLLVALDGDGVTTFLLVTTTMLPLYRKLHMRPVVLAAIATISFSVMSGMTPWGGPAARAMSVLGVDQSTYFRPFIATFIFACGWVVFVAYLMGRDERKRLIAHPQLATTSAQGADEGALGDALNGDQSLRRPKTYWLNLILTIVTMGLLVAGAVPSAALFLVAFVLALLLNYPSIKEQRIVLKGHADSALMIVLVVLVGGSFTGILAGTKMVDALAGNLVSLVPMSWAALVPTLIAIISIPFSFVMSNDAYFFGVIPVLAKAAAAYGVAPVEVIRAAVLAQPVHFILPLVPSTILLLGALGIEVRDHIKYSLVWSLLTCFVFILLAVLTGALSV